MEEGRFLTGHTYYARIDREKFGEVYIEKFGGDRLRVVYKVKYGEGTCLMKESDVRHDEDGVEFIAVIDADGEWAFTVKATDIFE